MKSFTRLPIPSQISLSAKGNYLIALHVINYYEGYLQKFLTSDVFRSTSHDHSSLACFYSLIYNLVLPDCTVPAVLIQDGSRQLCHDSNFLNQEVQNAGEHNRILFSYK